MRAIMTSQAVDSAPTKAAKILVVDDTPINTEILADLLVPLGHEVTLAHSGVSALELADTLRLANAKLTQEIGERRQAEDQLNFLARHDYLTRLLNRTAFEEALSVLLSRLSPGGVEHTLLYLDLDQFKLVNDTAGHMAGDEL